MGIKPALGWLGLLLFTTTAQAGGTRELLDVARGSSARVETRATKRPLPVAAAVTPKTKAPPPRITTVTASSSRGSLAVVETTAQPRTDYQAVTYAGVSLDSAVAKERGLDKGLVHLVFEGQRRSEFRVERDRIRRVVRLAAERTLATTSAATSRPATEHVDVLDTEDGVIVVDTAPGAGGLFVTSDVYVFRRNASLDQRIGALESLPSPVRARLREALVVAEWTPGVSSPK